MRFFENNKLILTSSILERKTLYGSTKTNKNVRKKEKNNNERTFSSRVYLLIIGVTFVGKK